MGILDFLKKQFIDVIQWTDEQPGQLVYRVPMADQEIQNGAKLVVRETQMAVFVDEGQVADVVGPGTFNLTSRTLPVLTNLRNWDKAFQSPFKSDVFYFSTKDQVDQRWGTGNPITIRDKDFGPLRMKAHGTYSYRVEDPKAFIKISGMKESYFTTELDGQLRAQILTTLASFLGGASVPFLDMAANQLKFSETLKDALVPRFREYGIKLQTFFVQSVSLPEELESHLDKAAQIKMVGDLGTYMQFQTADALSAAASNQSGGAGAGVGVGAGIAMGQAMASALGNAGGKSTEDVLGKIEKLHDMLKKGVLTQQEFDAKKAELLKKLS